MTRSLPPRDGAYRYAKWAARVRRDSRGRLPDGCSELMASRLADPEFVARVQASFEALYQLETSVRQVLNQAGAQVISFPGYLAYARQVWKLTNRVSGDAAALEAGRLKMKWQMRGLDPALLSRIGYEVFSLKEA